VSAENVKWRVNMAVRNSNLPSTARLVMLVLSDRADAKTGVIPERHSPSLADLAHDTDLGESTVKTQLGILEELGWVIRSRPDKKLQGRYASTKYQIRVGDPGKERTPHKRARSKPSQQPQEGQEMTDSEGQEQAISENQEGQEQAPRGPGASPKRARSKPPYIEDDDRNDRDDLKKAADAATQGGAAALFETVPPAPAVETEGQKVNRLARIFTDRHMSNFKAVSGVVRAAVRRTKPDGTRAYTDEQIADGMAKLADDGWTPTLNTLRIAIEGVPTQRKANHEGFKNPDPSEYHGTF
jgi:hypothetical protein